ncbi:chromophore lyase CpcT/CpeT [Myxacorys almedinensis]|uniref:Chromophore lyase CpcT/CpeT n=1 Tax=Myxacorys almedinensis A TaxID=2690445 RepID=A0A8J7Z4P6_9CYAN|nr:chromophore lyase CpcT/CpeT [Myxacorys almedinensis]NDJ19734.1 chorismate mutase [Myxacorys almedinensis A]
MSSLTILAQYLSGEFENREQAMASPAWFVHLRMWQRPVPLFSQDSITLFAEQANIINLDHPYRQRLMRLQEHHSEISIQYYAFKDPAAVKTGGQHPELLENLTEDHITLLPGCLLQVTQNADCFVAAPASEACCRFSYQGKTIQVALGFEARATQFLSYDKGVDPETGAALWGALMGAYTYSKQRLL